MEVRDPVHGSIHIHRSIIPIIRHEFFQRLRNIKQLGFSEYVFPGATHTRFIHSIGVMHIASLAFDRLFPNKTHKEFLRLRETFKLATLLHDIGHAPLSHSTESVMPMISKLKIPPRFLSDKDQRQDRMATHEDYTIKAIVDSSFAEAFELVEKEFGVDKNHVAELIIGQGADYAPYTIDGINYFPVLSQLVSSEIDCDRMDYLLRDSYFCGVSYGTFDLDWLLDNLEIAYTDSPKDSGAEKNAVLGINERAVVTFDDFLLSRYHMFIMVYFHYRAVCLEQMLLKYFQSSPGEYVIPASIEDYIEHDDHYLMKILKKSQNPYAEKIIKNQIPQKIFEAFNDRETQTFHEIVKYLDREKIDYIKCSSLGRLSKYYSPSEEDNKNKFPIKVVRKLFGTDKKITFDISTATDLFSKFSKSHGVNRIHCHFEELNDHNRLEILKLCGSI